MALERMLAGLSTRRYRVGLASVRARTEQAASATSRSDGVGVASPSLKLASMSCHKFSGSPRNVGGVPLDYSVSRLSPARPATGH